jgi:hypothetical protein
MSETTIEYIGYAAMAFIGISFIMKDIRKLRMLNLIGAGLFIFYGILLHQPPIYLLNSFIVIVNLYYLFQKKGSKK